MAAKRVLIVEDEWVVAEDLKQQLESFGFTIAAVAASGEEAVQQAVELQPELALLDITLSGEIDGIETARQIQERVDIPVVYLSANTDMETIQRARSTRPNGYLVKPVNPEGLRSTIEMALHNYEIECQLQRRMELEKLVATISTQFIHVSSQELGAALQKSLQMLGEYVGLQRCFIRLLSSDLQSYGSAYEWIEAGGLSVGEGLQGTSTRELKWILDRLAQMEVVELAGGSMLPSDEDSWYPAQDETALFIPLIVDGALTGLLAFIHQDLQRVWVEDDIRLFKIAAEIFANALARQQVDEELRQLNDSLEQRVQERTQDLKESEATFRVLAEKLLVGVYLYQDGEYRYINPRFAEIFGYPVSELAGRKGLLKMLVIPEDMPIAEHVLRRQADSYSEPVYYTLRGRKKNGELVYLEMLRSQIFLQGRQAIIGTVSDFTERRRTEDAYRTLVDHSLQGLYINQDGRIAYANQAFADMTGYSPAELFELDPDEVSSLTHPDDKEVVEQRIADRLAGKTIPPRLEYRLIHRDGSVRCVESYAAVVQFQGRQAVQSAVIDITERKRAEEAYRTLVDHSLQGLAITREGVILFSNPAHEAITGYKAEELSAMETFSEVHPGDRDVMRERAVRRAMGETVTPGLTYRILRKDGGVRWVESNAEPIEFQGEKALQLSMLDITARKLAEEALRESELRFRSLFENAPIGIVEGDISDEQRFGPFHMNHRAEVIWGWTSEEFNALSWDQVIPGESLRSLAPDLEGLRLGKSFTTECISNRQDGSYFPMRISGTPSPARGPKQVILSIEDITAERERRTEEEAITAERQRIAHEIHDGLAQDLSALRMRVAIWQDLIENEPQKMHQELDLLSKTLSDNIHGVRRLIFALRPFSLEERGFFTAVEDFIRGFNNLHPVRVVLTVEGPRERLTSRLEPILFRIIQEGLNNVGKHAQARTAEVKLDFNDPKNVCLGVRDDGIGFDPGTLQQVASKGHVGLTQMSERVLEVSGKFSLESSAGKGTSLDVVLPLESHVQWFEDRRKKGYGRRASDRG